MGIHYPIRAAFFNLHFPGIRLTKNCPVAVGNSRTVNKTNPSLQRPFRWREHIDGSVSAFPYSYGRDTIVTSKRRVALQGILDYAHLPDFLGCYTVPGRALLPLRGDASVYEYLYILAPE